VKIELITMCELSRTSRIQPEYDGIDEIDDDNGDDDTGDNYDKEYTDGD
jgi:hypothetical protein